MAFRQLFISGGRMFKNMIFLFAETVKDNFKEALTKRNLLWEKESSPLYPVKIHLLLFS